MFSLPFKNWFNVIAQWDSALICALTGISESVSNVMFDEQNIFDKDGICDGSTQQSNAVVFSPVICGEN